MKKKKKSKKRIPVPPIPQLSLEALDRVQKLERYARQELRDCEHTGHFNTNKAERILRTCTVQVLREQLAYYESLPNFHEGWVLKLQANTIASAVGMLPDGYGDELTQHFHDLLWDTTYADLNPPKTQSGAEKDSQKPNTSLAEQIKKLRDEARLTNEDLADGIGIGWRAIYRHLSGEAVPRKRQIAAYEKLFSKSLARDIRLEIPVKRQ
jgi:hypothetical protein